MRSHLIVQWVYRAPGVKVHWGDELAEGLLKAQQDRHITPDVVIRAQPAQRTGRNTLNRELEHWQHFSKKMSQLSKYKFNHFVL